MGNVSALPDQDHRQENAPSVDLWDAFWTLYPRHEAKKDALKAWRRMSESDRHAAVIAIADWRQVWKAQGRDTHLIPLPATWLNGERWEDEVPQGLIQRGSRSQVSQSGVVTSSLRESVSSPMLLPEHVLEMIARMKSKLKES